MQKDQSPRALSIVGSILKVSFIIGLIATVAYQQNRDPAMDGIRGIMGGAFCWCLAVISFYVAYKEMASNHAGLKIWRLIRVSVPLVLGLFFLVVGLVALWLGTARLVNAL